MDISPRKSLKRSADPVDDWLHSGGYFRKDVPRDPTCLFRAFAEQIYSTQHYHIRVRRECVDFMRKNHRLFEQSISVPLENYLEQMSCFTEWGGPNEIKAMSLLYEKEVFVFDGLTMSAKPFTDNGFDKTVYLCHTLQKQYESVYPREFIATAAYCQSLVYQTLYKKVFEMPNIDETVQKMLHDRSANYRHDRFFLKGNLEIREKLTTELFSKIEKGSDNSEEENSLVRSTTPFPYRVAKALDPNIYRNTDFDIWHELRREVRNSGWTRWNGAELQVGGKCYVQLDFKDKESLKTIINSGQSNNEKDSNGNASKEERNDQNSQPKNKTNFLHGHIQEMRKNEGPVDVFIEELGEIRTVPYAALKPIAPRRNKQNNWSANNCRRNSTYDSNQKRKRTWNSNNRKPKESSPGFVPKNFVDRNNNNNGDDNKIDCKEKDKEKAESWKEEVSDEKKNNSGLQTYTMETYNSCQGFPVENTIDVRPVTVVLDNAPPTIRATPSQPRNNDDRSKNSLQNLSKNSTINENPGRGSPNVGATAPETIIQPLQQVSLNSPGEAFYPHAGIPPPMFPVNQNILCAASDGNTYPLSFSCFRDEPPAPGSIIDHTIRAINFSATLSVAANGSDLPFSDPVTLRFFYNLGLESFRASHVSVYSPNGQPMNFPAKFQAPANFSTPDLPIETNERGSMGNEEDNCRSMGNISRQNCGNPRRRSDNPSSFTKFNNNNNGQQQIPKSLNNRKNDLTDFSNPLKNNEAVNKPILENPRSQNFPNNDRSKENFNVRKNFPPSRYKKNLDGRARNFHPPNVYQPENHQNPGIYENAQPPNQDSAMFSGSKGGDSSQQSANQGVWQSALSQQSINSGIGNNQQANYQAAYGHQTIYTTVPFYPSEGDTFFAHGPNFYPIPYVPAGHTEVIDGNSGNNFGPQTYQSENYAPPISGIYSPFVYSQQTIFPALPQQQQNSAENWFALSGQTPFFPYPNIHNPQTASNGNNPGAPSP